MAFDPSTARPVQGGEGGQGGGFDPASAQPVQPEAAPQQAQAAPQQPTGADPQAMVSPYEQDPGLEQRSNMVMGAINDFAKMFNLGVADVVDFLGPDVVNAGLRVAGSEYQVPTARGFVESLETPTRATLPEGMLKDTIQAAGYVAPGAASLYQVAGRNLAKAPGAIAEIAGLGSAAPVAPAAGMVESVFGEAQRRQALPHLLQETGDASAAGYRLKPGQPITAPAAVKDASQRTAMRMGFEPAMMSYINSATPQAKEKMLQMVRILKGGHENLRNRVMTPWEVIGDSVVSRYDTVLAKNKAAGKAINEEAKKLRGKFRANPEPAMKQFYEDLSEVGVEFSADKDGFLAPKFENSQVWGVGESEQILERLIKRMQISKRPDGFDMHNLKQFIDTMVDYGGNKGEGLSGVGEQITKNFRHNLNELLRNNYPDYAAANTAFADTKGALNKLRDAAGTRVNLGEEGAAEIVGKISGRMANKAISGVDLRNAILALDDVAANYSLPVPNDEVRELVEFVNSLERVIRPGYSGDFSSKIGAGLVREGAKMGMGMSDGRDTIASVLNWGAKKATGTDEASTLDALEELLSR